MDGSEDPVATLGEVLLVPQKYEIIIVQSIFYISNIEISPLLLVNIIFYLLFFIIGINSLFLFIIPLSVAFTLVVALKGGSDNLC